ncbi:MAG: alpha/beta fold hydrolase [Halieaceae bacterium]|jgi:polyhydroxyalkanoate synthase|nr:alpha/beta fold hydrolase [Halieaceae bacterium]
MNANYNKSSQAEGERADSTVALSPLTGLHPGDLLQTAARLAYQGLRQPLVFGKHLSSHTRKLVDILASQTDYQPQAHDRRFRDKAWQEQVYFQRLLQAYLAFNESLAEWIDDLDLNDVERLRAEFLVRLVSDSIAPTNSILGNPEALRKAVDTRGASLMRGLGNLLKDVRDNHGIPSQVDETAFKVGENLAVTPGSVVFRNDVLELIQYQPTTAQVHRRPVLLLGAMINKFYAFDLSPERSMVRYSLDKGLQVFVVSWANPGREHAHWGLETYAMAVIDAMQAVKNITGSDDLNIFCLCSAAMVSSALAAYLSAIEDNSINAMTIGVCMLDMQKSDMEMSAFATEEIMARAKQRSRKAGILRGHELALSMLWMRPQDLIWDNVVNNYLLGNDPPEFDLLYWNSDRTNLPASLHADIVDMFATGGLLQPGVMQLNGVALDLQAVECDKFFIAGESDHITPWKACYRAARGFGGNLEFVLSRSGHIQTFLNSPSKRKASFLTSPDVPGQAERWLETAELQKGSWWDYWWKWIKPRSGKKKRAPRKPGNRIYPPGEAAPGTYVHQKADER